MKTLQNLKGVYYQADTPLLEEDFDLFSAEVIDFLSSQKLSKEYSKYMMSVEPYSKKKRKP